MKQSNTIRFLYSNHLLGKGLAGLIYLNSLLKHGVKGRPNLINVNLYFFWSSGFIDWCRLHLQIEFR